MNAIKNKVQLIGHLGDIPEITDLEDGKKKASFMVLTEENYKNAKGEKVKDTQMHKIICWGKLAEIAEKYLSKGIEVAIEGKLVNSHYTDSNGVIRHVTEIHANELLILTKRA
ncbi:MAG: single-stranded DNA-binding protein [Bacteroidota bacterium]